MDRAIGQVDNFLSEMDEDDTDTAPLGNENNVKSAEDAGAIRHSDTSTREKKKCKPQWASPPKTEGGDLGSTNLENKETTAARRTQTSDKPKASSLSRPRLSLHASTKRFQQESQPDERNATD